MPKTLTNDEGQMTLTGSPVAHGGDPQDLAGSQMTTLTSRDVPWHVSTFVPTY
jgi:hypothetical protein